MDIHAIAKVFESLINQICLTEEPIWILDTPFTFEEIEQFTKYLPISSLAEFYRQEQNADLQTDLGSEENEYLLPRMFQLKVVDRYYLTKTDDGVCGVCFVDITHVRCKLKHIKQCMKLKPFLCPGCDRRMVKGYYRKHVLHCPKLDGGSWVDDYLPMKTVFSILKHQYGGMKRMGKLGQEMALEFPELSPLSKEQSPNPESDKTPSSSTNSLDVKRLCKLLKRDAASRPPFTICGFPLTEASIRDPKAFLPPSLIVREGIKNQLLCYNLPLVQRYQVLRKVQIDLIESLALFKNQQARAQKRSGPSASEACYLCKRPPFKKDTELIAHLCRHLDLVLFRCNVCSEAFYSYEEFLQDQVHCFPEVRRSLTFAGLCLYTFILEHEFHLRKTAGELPPEIHDKAWERPLAWVEPSSWRSVYKVFQIEQEQATVNQRRSPLRSVAKHRKLGSAVPPSFSVVGKKKMLSDTGGSLFDESSGSDPPFSFTPAAKSKERREYHDGESRESSEQNEEREVASALSQPQVPKARQSLTQNSCQQQLQSVPSSSGTALVPQPGAIPPSYTTLDSLLQSLGVQSTTPPFREPDPPLPGSPYKIQPPQLPQAKYLPIEHAPSPTFRRSTASTRESSFSATTSLSESQQALLLQKRERQKEEKRRRLEAAARELKF